MQAKHVWLRADEEGKLLDFPELPPSCRIEAIFPVEYSGANTTLRVPPAEIISVTSIHGNLLELAIALVD